MTKTVLLKKQGTKNAWKVDEVENEKIDLSTHERITGKDTLQWFRRWGGSETAQRSYTYQGYKVTRLISTSPAKDKKIVREFKFLKY